MLSVANDAVVIPLTTNLSIMEDGEGIHITPVKGDYLSLKGSIAVERTQDDKAIRHKAMEDVVCDKAKAD